MSHTQLLGIDVTHTYYSNGLCGDFSVAPTTDTARLLRNHRCVLKTKANGVDIYVETVGDKELDRRPKIAFGKNATLSFELYLKNFEFPLFTDFTQKPPPQNAQPKEGLPIGDNDFQITTCYPGLSGKADQAFAKIDIHRDFNQVGGKNIGICFSAKPVCWVYYLITDPDTSKADFSVVGLNSQSISWSKATETDHTYQKLADQYPGTNILKFVASQLVPCQESRSQHIQLLLGGNTIIESLPHPSWRNHFQIELEANKGNVDAIFQVVKYLPTQH